MEPLTHAHVVAKEQTPRGFTLVELVVVLAIIIIITTITITSQTAFDRSLLVTNTAYSVALSVREAQSLGLSSRTFGGIQNTGYGVHFSNTNSKGYYLFADIVGTPAYTACPTGTANTPEAKPGNCVYDSTTEIVKSYNLNQGFTIMDFCGVMVSNGATVCGSHSGWASMNIAFLRPNTEAIFTGVTTSGVRHALQCAVIWIAPPGDTESSRCIVVSQVGQVSVPNTCPATNFVGCP